MLTKKDRQQLISDFKDVFATKDDLKSMEDRQDQKYATKVDLIGFATKVDLQDLAKQKDLLDVKGKLDDLYSLSVLAFGNLFDWVEDIHKTIVKKDLPKRVKKLERYLRTS